MRAIWVTTRCSVAGFITYKTTARLFTAVAISDLQWVMIYWVSVVDLYCAIAFTLTPLVSACRNRTRSCHYPVAIVPVLYFRINGDEVGVDLGVCMVSVSPFYSETHSRNIPRFHLVRIGKVVLFDINLTSSSMNG